MKNKFKKIKFKDDCLSWKKHNQIIFEEKNIKKFYDMMDVPSKWHHKKEQEENGNGVKKHYLPPY